jgi:enoyl-CoA hydratase/carnithine racemase
MGNGSQAGSGESQGSTAPDVRVDLFDDGTIAVLSLDDEARGNAMSPQMGDAFRQRAEDLASQNTLRAVIVRGAGTSFSLGGLRDMLTHLSDENLTYEYRRDFMLGFYDRWLALLDIPVPVIAAIEGDCIGVAPGFACLSDVCLVDERANFQITFTNLGLYPGMALSHLVPRCVGPQRGGLTLLAAQPFTGAEAAAAGMATRAVAPGKVHEEALTVARQLAANVPGPMWELTTQLRIRREEIQPVLEFDADQQARSYATAEFRQRIANYLSNQYDKPPATVGAR